MRFRPPPFRLASAAFTLIEIAISLAVIGVALVAIIGVLPLGMNVQRENREGTIVNQDATVFLEAISKGAQGLNDLTNYVYGITNNWTQYGSLGVPGAQGVNGYGYNGSSVTWPLPSGSAPLTNGYNIIGLLGTPQLMDLSGNPTNNLFSGGYSNHVYAYARAISGSAAEKPPQNNAIIQGDAFAYRILCVNAPVAVDTNVFSLSAAEQDYSQQLNANLHELRLTFFWPIQPNGKVGMGRQTYRTLIPGLVSQAVINNANLYFYQPQSFTNAP